MSGPITAAAVTAAREDLAPTGEAYVDLAVTGATVASIAPHWRREVASFLTGILARRPLADGGMYEAHQAILGSLILDLETSAIVDALAEPEPADLRDPGIVAAERELIRATRDWASLEQERQAAALHARVDVVIEASRREHEMAQERLDAAVAAVAAPATHIEEDVEWMR